MKSTEAEWEGREIVTNFHNLGKNGLMTITKVCVSTLRSTNPILKHTIVLIQTASIQNKSSMLSSFLLSIQKLLTTYGDTSYTLRFSE